MKTERRERALPAGIARILPRSARWPLLGFALALGILTAVSNVRAQDEQSCSEAINSACTATQELAFCVITAMDEYDDCKSGGGFRNWIGCTVLYEADFYVCALEFPLQLIR